MFKLCKSKLFLSSFRKKRNVPFLHLKTLIPLTRGFTSSPLKILEKNVKMYRELTIGVPRENSSLDKSSPIDDDAVEELTQMGFKVNVESLAGGESYITDDLFAFSGAEITDARTALGSDIVVKSNPPTEDEIKQMKPSVKLFCEFRDEHCPVLKKLNKRNIYTVDTNKLSNGTLVQWTNFFVKDTIMEGVTWAVMGKILDNYGKHFRSYKHGDKICGKAKVFVESGLGCISFNRFLLSAGAEVDSDILNDNVNLKKYDVVILSDVVGKKAPVFTKELTKRMKQGSILADFHRDETPRYENSHPEKTIKEDGITIISHQFSNPTIHNEGLSKYRGSIFVTSIKAASIGENSVDFNHDFLKATEGIYKTPPKSYNKRVEDFRHTGKLKTNEKIILAVAGTALCGSVISYKLA